MIQHSQMYGGKCLFCSKDHASADNMLVTSAQLEAHYHMDCLDKARTTSVEYQEEYESVVKWLSSVE